MKCTMRAFGQDQIVGDKKIYKIGTGVVPRYVKDVFHNCQDSRLSGLHLRTRFSNPKENDALRTNNGFARDNIRALYKYQ
jgi:hypothetical protein